MSLVRRALPSGTIASRDELEEKILERLFPEMVKRALITNFEQGDEESL
jgi:hypothetical protein